MKYFIYHPTLITAYSLTECHLLNLVSNAESCPKHLFSVFEKTHCNQSERIEPTCPMKKK